jgi:hypothetical protein
VCGALSLKLSLALSILGLTGAETAVQSPSRSSKRICRLRHYVRHSETPLGRNGPGGFNLRSRLRGQVGTKSFSLISMGRMAPKECHQNIEELRSAPAASQVVARADPWVRGRQTRRQLLLPRGCERMVIVLILIAVIR